MADQAEYGFLVADPYNSFMGFGNVKLTSTFNSDVPERKGVSLLIVHGVGADAWRSDKTKAKFLLINLPFKTLTVKRLALKKKTVLGIYMEERGEGRVDLFSALLGREEVSLSDAWVGHGVRVRFCRQACSNAIAKLSQTSAKLFPSAGEL